MTAGVNTPYQDWLRSSAPPWLQRKWGAAWSEVYGLLWDVVADAARKAVLARFIASAPSDALPFIASERMLEPMPGEAEATWRARLLNAWDAWPWAGTLKGVRDNVMLTGLTNVGVFEAWDWPTAAAGQWGRFWVVIGKPHPWFSDGNWGDPGNWGDGGTWGSTATLDEVARVCRQVRLWKPAHAHCMGVIVMLGSDASTDATTWTESAVFADTTRFAQWIP